MARRPPRTTDSSRRLRVAAVTGTNGKTTTVEYARQLMDSGQRRAVSVSSRGTTDPDGRRRTPFFLSEPGCWRRMTRELDVENDVAVLEAWSGGLSAGEWDGVEVDTAALTTFGHDHLDLHGDLEGYADAKLRLFRSGVRAGGTVVLPAACALYPRVRRATRERSARCIVYARSANGHHGDIVLRRAEADDHGGTRVSMDVFGARRSLHIPLPASFLIDNALLALGIAISLDVPADEAVEKLSTLRPVPGRMEAFTTSDGVRVYVDYAHTPDALDAVLLEVRQSMDAREHPPTGLRVEPTGRLVAVLGCGGSRDRFKRRAMGEIASRRADHVIVTDDSPRWEDPARIREEILRGCRGADEIPDRPTAIAAAIRGAGPADVVVVCGRGAESHQDYGSVLRSGSDADSVARAGGRPATTPDS